MKIIHFIKTSGLVYDARLVKEVESLNEVGVESAIAALIDENIASSGRLDCGAEWETLSLWSRRAFPSARFLLAKSLEASVKYLRIVKREKADVVWVHDLPLLAVVFVFGLLWKPFGRRRRIIWDHHELANDSWFEKPLTRFLMRSCIHMSDVVVGCNVWRQEVLCERLRIRKTAKFFVIQNLAALSFSELGRGELPEKLSEWLGGERFALFQGMGRESRCAVEVGRAVKRFGGIKLVFLGPVDADVETGLRAVYGDDFESSVYVTGMTPQNELYRVIDHAEVSLVFYREINKNNWLCAPNRLYQAIARGVPVICGSNPPMECVVRESETGVVVQGDGHDDRKIEEGLRLFYVNRERFADNAKRNRDRYLWENQGEVFRLIVQQISDF